MFFRLGVPNVRYYHYYYRYYYYHYYYAAAALAFTIIFKADCIKTFDSWLIPKLWQSTEDAIVMDTKNLKTYPTDLFFCLSHPPE